MREMPNCVKFNHLTVMNNIEDVTNSPHDWYDFWYNEDTSDDEPTDGTTTEFLS